MRLQTILLSALVLLGMAASAHAGTAALAPMPNAANGSLTAYGGWIIWSASDSAGSRWQLMAFHAGRVRSLAIAARRVPFDADAGPDAHGRPALVYSRCAIEPPTTDGTLDWAKARGCRLYQYTLP
jgi:hypothetical protein